MTRRVQKVAELLKQQLAEMIKETLPEELGLVTVTEVEVSLDLKNALVFVSCLAKQNEEQVIKKLQEKTLEFQHILGRRLEMKYTPKIVYKIDNGIDKINRVEEILKNLSGKNQ